MTSARGLHKLITYGYTRGGGGEERDREITPWTERQGGREKIERVGERGGERERQREGERKRAGGSILIKSVMLPRSKRSS